jgi:hypothetical protein
LATESAIVFEFRAIPAEPLQILGLVPKIEQPEFGVFLPNYQRFYLTREKPLQDHRQDWAGSNCPH